MSLIVVVATHKNYKMPRDDMYVPIHAGRSVNPAVAVKRTDKELVYLCDCIGDNTGENISCKNANYCELTCLYWAWKNLKASYIGLVHYRRHFKGLTGYDEWSSVLTQGQAEALLKKYQAILPKKRNYFIETTYTQYIHAHNKQDLDATLEIIKEFYPKYVPAWEKVMKRTSGHRFNMFIMRKDILDSYCEWLFDILFKLEDRLDISGYSKNDSRVFGFVAERLLDVWIETNNIHYTELPVINMEGENWPKKIKEFLKRKFIGE